MPWTRGRVAGCCFFVSRLLLSGLTEKWFAVFFGILPILYGADVLISKGGKMKILSIGNYDFKP